VPRLVLYPLIRGVAGLAAGIYRYAPERHVLLRVAEVASGSDRQLMLQQDHERAAAVLVIAVPMAAWLRHAGDRGYRAAALAVGWLTDHLYLTAESLGLSYTASGGFSPPLMDRTIGLDGIEWTAFFSFVLGGAETHE
jgi:SagB-type dehydrogenase family enzyme